MAQHIQFMAAPRGIKKAVLNEDCFFVNFFWIISKDCTDFHNLYSRLQPCPLR